jgi:hypothetical protein
MSPELRTNKGKFFCQNKNILIKDFVGYKPYLAGTNLGDVNMVVHIVVFLFGNVCTQSYDFDLQRHG